jgi:hypothetical protein
VKSMTASRAKLMVMAPSAMSALPSISSAGNELVKFSLETRVRLYM